MTWSVEKGKLLAFAADLPPGWTPDGAVSAIGEPVPWHADRLGNGGTRVHLVPAIADEASRSVTMTLFASASQAGVTGPLDLPRVRPASGVRVVDEVWVATHDPGLAIRPILASGLAWLDPPERASRRRPGPLGRRRPPRRPGLAMADGRRRGPDRPISPGADPRGEVKLEAAIRSGRLALDWTIDVESPQGGLDSVPIHVEPPVGGPISWKIEEAGGVRIESRPLDESLRAGLGFPSIGLAWDLPLAGPSKGKVRISGRFDGPWAGRGRLPILTLPDRYKARGTVAVAVESPTRVRFDTTGLTPIESPAPSGDLPASTGERISPRVDSTRIAGVFGYRSGGGKLVVETTDPPPGSEQGTDSRGVPRPRKSHRGRGCGTAWSFRSSRTRQRRWL